MAKHFDDDEFRCVCHAIFTSHSLQYAQPTLGISHAMAHIGCGGTQHSVRMWSAC